MDKLGESCLGIKKWYSPQDGQEILADIVAVHGLAANPYWTWVGKPKKTTGRRAPRMSADQEDPQSVIWLQELLPHRLPNCRILTFGYRSDYLIKAPKRDIANCAQELLVALLNNRTGPCAGRPLIFLGHSFGGVVIKEALVKATLAARAFGDIKRSTQGVVFLGTPHHGSSAAAYGEMLVAAAQAIGTGSNRELLRSLRKMSPELMKLASNFNDIFEDFEVFCFYEGLPTKLSSVIVTKDSAVIPNRLNDILIADHSGLNKFHDSNDPNFDKVAQALSNMT
ncbi:hypothetical protein BKA66DRAFT_24702 [Pyrenochaeta sp. MPI-SDFR-AT-0127]|nr:hypothetical protein BKA66DRAFT_24702 [Pyrenochaeta sp. MPI-SDFR-AT-0127]